MKTTVWVFAMGCASVALLASSATAAPPRRLPSANLKFGAVASTPFSSVGSKVSLNPQPLPPRYLTPSRRLNPGLKVGLNPQPLPPRVFKSF